MGTTAGTTAAPGRAAPADPMTLPHLVYAATGLAAVLVLLTAFRHRSGSPVRSRTGAGWVAPHTFFGLLGTALWLLYLVGQDAMGEGLTGWVGIAAVGCWWIVTLAGVRMMLRWRTRHHGRHADRLAATGWWLGPWVSLAVLVLLTAITALFTWVYLTAAV